MYRFVPPRDWQSWLWLLPLFALTAWIFWPVTAGDFVADDYVFLATGRMVDTPLAVFWQSHFYEPYYFRPLGVLSWWVATRLFGLDYAAHSLINLALHGLNGGLLFALMRVLALRPIAALAGVSLFMLGPFAVAAMLWPSNRFDLLAVGFLLIQAIAMHYALRGSVAATVLAAMGALAACWGKELAYPVATTLACFALLARDVSWRRRLTLFVALGGAISLAFLVRHAVLADAYALTATDPLGRVLRGSIAMAVTLPRLVSLIAGDAGGAATMALMAGSALILLAAWVQIACAKPIIAHRTNSADARLLGGVCLVWLAAFVVQTPLAAAFAPMADGAVFGTVSFARFYYAPWAATCVLVAVSVSFVCWSSRACGGALALAIAGIAVPAGIGSRKLGESFAAWTQAEVRPVSMAATTVTEQVATGADGLVCVVVLLGTEVNHPYFRMFSDVTVKARTVAPNAVWRCHVMTERTPWLFAFPMSVAPMELPLRRVPDFGGKQKADSMWGGIRYRYRLPVADIAALPDARFFDWYEGRFVEVTEAVRRGERKVALQDW